MSAIDKCNRKLKRLLNMSKGSSTGIRIFPPLVYVVGIQLGMLIEIVWPSIEVALNWRLLISIPLLLGSLLLIAFTLKEFKSVATPFDVRKSASNLITGGPFKMSRNPGYVSLTMLYLSFGFGFGSLWVLLLVVPVTLIIDIAVIRKEEASLLMIFGESYSQYQLEVRRWL